MALAKIIEKNLNRLYFFNQNKINNWLNFKAAIFIAAINLV